MTGRLQVMAEGVKSKLKDETRDTLAQIALTTDIWTSMSNDAYLSVTASYITGDWQLQMPVLTTVSMEERHTADYIAQCLKTTTDEWGISDKVSAVLHDGAANITDTGRQNSWVDINS